MATAAAMVAVMAVGIGIGWVSHEQEFAQAMPVSSIYLYLHNIIIAIPIYDKGSFDCVRRT